MKNGSRNKFLLCFRPVADMDSCLVLDSEGNGSRKSTITGPSVKYISSDHKDCSKSSSKKKFSQSKRERKSLSQDEFDRKLVKSFSAAHIQEIKSNPIFLSSQSSLGLSSSSSSCCSVSESKISGNNNQERVPKPNKKSPMGSTSSCSSSCYYAISLLLISLAVTILWGKVCAIFFTSIWFYFLPQQTNCQPLENEKEKMVKAKRESKESYKKRIITEGLLERTTTKRLH